MRRTTKRAIVTALTSATVAVSIIGIGATSASAINPVPCDSDEYLKVTAHFSDNGGDSDICYANGGEQYFYAGGWVTRIWTGNNRVQWYGDGRWQPDQPIGKTTTFTWPNHPGGVWVERVRIV